tara:strand:- start:103 stop:372 length:270 start_codon:yes stop_codon:yes gene_type:complete
MKKANKKQASIYTVKVISQPRAYRVGSARALYWHTINSFNGKPLAELTAAVTANPPSLPTKGKHAGVAEPFKGWLNFFIRNGNLKLTTK